MVIEVVDVDKNPPRSKYRAGNPKDLPINSEKPNFMIQAKEEKPLRMYNTVCN